MASSSAPPSTAAAFEWTPNSANGTSGKLTQRERLWLCLSLSPTGVNRSGDIVGIYVGSDDQPHGFLIHHGTAQDIGTLGGSSAVANAINNDGVVVGASDTASGDIHALDYDGKLHDLGTASRARPLQRGLRGQRSRVSRWGAPAHRPATLSRQSSKSGHVASIGTLGGAIQRGNRHQRWRRRCRIFANVQWRRACIPL